MNEATTSHPNQPWRRKITYAWLLVGILTVLAFALRPAKADGGTKIEVISKATSPSGKYEAELTKRTEAWGLGLAAVSCEYKITKHGPSGWFYQTKLEFDSINSDYGCPDPSMTWVGPNELRISIVTRNVSGRIERKQDDLLVRRVYTIGTD